MVEEQLKQLAEVLQYTLSADKKQRQEAEKYLETVEGTANYGILLLQLLTLESASSVIRTAAAVNFKNFVKRNWRIVEGETSKISENDRTLIKSHIVELMLKSPETIQKQLSDAISIIGREDFPEKWKDLLGNLTSHMKVSENLNLHIVNGVLQTAHSLFKRFRYEFKSQELWTELKFVLENFASPLLDLFEGMIEKIPKAINNAAELKPIIEVLIVICKLFYSLNYQDLPEFFEDNMKRWMDPFHMVLVADLKVLKTDDTEEAGPIERIRSQICDSVTLYAQKYDEEFRPYLPNFVDAIWNLLTSTGNEVKHDLETADLVTFTEEILNGELHFPYSVMSNACLMFCPNRSYLQLVSNAIQFLASVCERPHYKDLFSSQDILKSICQNVIVPNMMFRDTDEELFEDNPEEYIRKDIEGSDIDTRRRAACDLVRGLCKYYEQIVTAIFSEYVNAMLRQYSQNPKENWKSKDAAIFVVTSLAAKKSTAKHGTTEANQLVNLVDFYNSQIVADLNSPNVDEVPVLKADAIKYLITFRSLLPKEIVLASFSPLVTLLSSKSNVVHSYAANAIERLLILRSPSRQQMFSVAELLPLRDQMFRNLFGAFDHQGSEENEYIMKAVMRSCVFLQDKLVDLVPTIIGKLADKLMIVCKNPRKPQFNHYLFESICTLIRGVGRSSQDSVTQIESALFPVLQYILQNDVTEFLPYIFQVLSLALEYRKDGVKGPYMDLFPLLLQPVLWERTGNIPALTRLLQAYVKRGAEEIISGGSLMPLLGVFQKLIASRANDHEGFYLLSSMIQHMPWQSLETQMSQVFILLFQRLKGSKTTKFVKGFIVFISLFAGKVSADTLQKTIDNVQANLFGMMIEKIFTADLQKISGNTERKICAVGVTKILTETPAMLNQDNLPKWTPLLEAVIGLFELPEDTSVPDDEHFIDVEDIAGYQTAFSQLAYASKKDSDPFHDIIDAEEYLAKQLYRLSVSHPGKLMPLISQGLNTTASQHLQTYLLKAQVQLA